MRLELYTQQSAEFHNSFNMPRLYYNDMTWVISKFKAKFSIDFVYFYEPSYFCISMYYGYDDIPIELKMAMKMQECLKDVISCIYHFDNWSAIDAKYFQECKQSSQEYITMYTKTHKSVQNYLMGADDKTASALDTESCFPKVLDFGALLTFFGSPAHNLLVKNMVQYVATAMQ